MQGRDPDVPTDFTCCFPAGPVTNEFVIEGVDNQLDTAQQPQHMARLISAGVCRCAAASLTVHCACVLL